MITPAFFEYVNNQLDIWHQSTHHAAVKALVVQDFKKLDDLSEPYTTIWRHEGKRDYFHAEAQGICASVTADDLWLYDTKNDRGVRIRFCEGGQIDYWQTDTHNFKMAASEYYQDDQNPLQKSYQTLAVKCGLLTPSSRNACSDSP